MKLQHHIGGLESLHGPLNFEKRVFVEDWEKRIFGIHVAMMALSTHLGSALPRYPIAEVPTAFDDKWTWADLRTSAEAMNPFDYFKFRYYEKWLGAITQFLVDKAYLSADELAARTVALPSSHEPAADTEAVDTQAIDTQVLAYLRMGDSPRRDVAHPKFAVGDVVTIVDLPAGAHTRLPGYLRGRVGTVTRVFEGDYAYFEHTADGIGAPMPNYLVEFSPAELWGSAAEDGRGTVCAELFEAYLKGEA
ncbi:nitrile hydratase subunit beta [Mycobacterium sp. 1100029.7]|nr:nitrile hydratase subunit beta [Mycobacterium sp. 1100029.7]